MLRSKVCERLHALIYRNFWKSFWLARELFLGRIKMIFVNMYIAKRVHDLADVAPQYLRDDMREERITCDVEGDAQKNVGTSLVELERHLLVLDVHLIHVVADGEVVHFLGLCHCIQIFRIPRSNDGVMCTRVLLQFLNCPIQRVNSATIFRRPRPPHLSVDAWKLAVLTRE